LFSCGQSTVGEAVGESNDNGKEPDMLVLLALNVPLMIVFFALWVGVPAWLVLRRREKAPAVTFAPTVHRLPEQRSHHRRAA
jgi:hypothetical protein